jgi:phosphate transport system permease protein
MTEGVASFCPVPIRPSEVRALGRDPDQQHPVHPARRRAERPERDRRDADAERSRSDPYDQLQQGADRPRHARGPSAAQRQQIASFDTLVSQGVVTRSFNWGLFFNADSRFPEMAGLAGAIVGSFYALLVCFLISFPIGIAAAIYLEEFAPKNRITT